MIEFDQTLLSRNDLPLYGKRVLFTTPRNYAAKFARLLVLRGALPVWMPTIVIEPMADYTEFDAALKSISEYDWVAFTSRNGIEAFFDRTLSLGFHESSISNIKLCALGNDAAALEQRGIKVDLVPPVATTKGIVDEMERRGVKSGRVLLPVPEVVGMKEPRVVPDLVKWLSEIGLDPHRVPAYSTTRVRDGLEVEKQMLINGAIDIVAFTSAAEIESLLFLLGDHRDVLNKNTIACYGPVTAGGAKERNVRVEIVSKDFSRLEGFIEAVEEHINGEDS